MAELDGYKTEWLVTGGDQSEVGSTEQVRRKSSELGLGEDVIRIQFHQPCQFFRGETTIKINHRADADELNSRLLLQPIRIVSLMEIY